MKHPKINEFLRGAGMLIAIEDAKPAPPPPKDYIFERVEARIEVRLGTEILKTRGTLWDFDGLEASVRTAIEEASEYAAERKIGPDSELEVVVIKIVSRTRMRPTGHPSLYVDGYEQFEQPSIGCARGMPDDVETIVWSTRECTSRP